MIAAVIRLYHIQNRGLWYWDEGLFIMGARFLRWRIYWLSTEILQFFGFVSQIPPVESYQGYPVFLQKPVHVILLSVFSAFFDNDILAAIHYSIIAGLLTIVLTAELGRMWFNPLTGLLAATWLAIQPAHVHYSRLALHEMDSMALFLVLLLGWSRFPCESDKSLKTAATGFALGFTACLTIGTSYRYLPYVALACLWEFTGFLSIRSTFTRFRLRWLGMLLGVLFCVILLNFCYRLAFYPEFSWSEPASYIEVLRIKFLSDESSFDAKHLWYYIRMFYRFDGLFPTVIWVIALAVLPLRRTYSHLKLASWLLLPLILFSLTTTRVPRTVTGLYPFIALTWASLIDWMTTASIPLKSHRVRATTAIALCVISFGAMFSQLPAIWILKSGYPDVIEWLRKQPDARHFSTMYPVYAVYQGRESVGPVAFTLDEIARDVRNTGIRYLTVDWQKFLRYSRGVYEIEKAVLPVFAVPHDPGAFFASLYENHLPSDVPLLQQDATLQYLKVYDLYQALPALGYRLNLPEISDE